jgi:hypothetical protein
MAYVSFDEQITKRHGIVVKNWPLTEFKNPSSVGTKTELEILWNAWNSDATHFYRMTKSEYDDWITAYEAASELTGGGESVSGSAVNGGVGITEGGQAFQAVGLDSPSSTSQSTAASNATTATATAHANFVALNMVTDANGVAVAVKRATRKKRSDAGKPRKQKAQVNGGAA